MTHLKNLSRLTRAAMMLLVMLLTATTGWADAPSHKIVVIADPHVMGDGLLTNQNNADWATYIAGSRKLIDKSQVLFDQAVSVIQTQKPELVLIVGDLTKDGEQASHDYVKGRLNELKDAGIQPLVIPGNHDLGTSDAKVYGETTTAATTIAGSAAFATLYADYGYGLPTTERESTTLTYACEPIDGLVVIGIDSGTDGTLSVTTLNWVCDKALAARAAGKQVIAMMHHPLIPHITGGETFVSNVSVSDYANVRNRLADAGITTIFTGHFHTSDIAKDWNADKTETIYDITTGSLCSYPCDYRVVTLNNAMTEMSIATETATGITEAKDRLTTVMTNLAKEKIQTKLVNEGMNATLAAYAANIMGPKMASAYIYHAEGDENSNDDAQTLLTELNTTFASYPAYQALVNSMLLDKSNYGDADREDQTNDRTLTGISMPLVVSTWAQLKAACEAGGTVTLTNDVTRNAAERILIENTTVTVDLNGHTIRGYADDSSTHYDGYSIFYVNTGGSLTITDGSLTITDGSSVKRGTIANVWGTSAVCIGKNGSVTMTGGTICDATGGVNIYDGSFTMTGGTITGNGRGVEINSEDATFTVSGDVNITRNNAGDDVRLCYENDSFNPIHIGSDGLAATARIGVKRGAGWDAGKVKPFTSGLPGKGTKSNFVLNANDPYYMVTAPNGELALIHPLELPKDNKENYLITGGIYFYREGEDGLAEYLKWKAIIDASSTETLCIPTNIVDWSDEDGVEVWGVAYDRTFNPGKASTVMLPFSYNIQSTEGGVFYSFIGVYQEDGKWVAMMDGRENLQANTPYLFVPDEGSTTMSFPGIDYSNPVRLTTEGGGGQHSIADNWVFQGTYAALSWTAGSTGDKTKIVGSEEEEAIYYGFAATSGKATDGETDVEVGQFVQVASGASIKPTRAYLKFTGGANARGAAAAEELPKTISVRLVKKGETMGIPTPDPSRAGGEDGYYTLSGQRLTNGQKPTAKGLYIINGRKEVVK